MHILETQQASLLTDSTILVILSSEQDTHQPSQWLGRQELGYLRNRFRKQWVHRVLVIYLHCWWMKNSKQWQEPILKQERPDYTGEMSQVRPCKKILPLPALEGRLSSRVYLGNWEITPRPTDTLGCVATPLHKVDHTTGRLSKGLQRKLENSLQFFLFTLI